ncbi:hypothetical protein [Altericroceibacterium xinjiangense]|uniref:hypothetical protein n=1 Tax=Altericroceibacterium xinjiangense TaxID=762261 RepID=UPI000F7F2379|nr:hypothetical protein [Altericroceibacterium xinjiangense]
MKKQFPPASIAAIGMAAALAGLLAFAPPGREVSLRYAGPTARLPQPGETIVGINLFGLAPFNRQQVFSNLVTQSEWFSSKGQGWTAMPASQLDRLGWVRYLEPGQTAPRPLILPPAPFKPIVVRCDFQGSGELTAGGVAHVRDSGEQSLTLDLVPAGTGGEGAWIELVRTDPADPVRAIDCREADRPTSERFHPEFLSFLEGFRVIRFLDWQRINDNAAVRWSTRTLPESGSQAGPAGASIEDMVDLANALDADPWFQIPYRADDTYIRKFAHLVHERIDPARTVYVELGNEVWNDMFAAAQQAEREGLSLGLGDGDPTRAQMIRYADKHAHAMRIWTEAFADRPQRLVRVAASQNAWPDLAEIVLGHEDTAAWTDALATAPYLWLDLNGYEVRDVDRVFAAMPGALDETFAFAARNRAIAARYGKRYIAYEGGQHLVTPDLALARALQRDPRMEEVYARYLGRWEDQVGDTLTLYASTAPIADYGSWGLREYAGQPENETPKLRAVTRFRKAAR